MAQLFFPLELARTRSLFRCRGPTAAPKQHTRLDLEFLECRCVPSTVTTLADAGLGSLRDALAVTPAGGTVDFQPSLSGTITLTSATLTITQDVTIAGPGVSVITISGNNTFQVFNIAPAITVTISGLTIANGNTRQGFSGNPGGGIYNSGTLIINHSTVSGNLAGGFGGGIYNHGRTLTIIGSTISDNGAVGRGGGAGGGIDNAGGTLTIIQSTCSGNGANGGFIGGGQGAGGGIDNSGTLIIIASTVSDNSAQALGVFGGGEASGGGIANAGTLTIIESTLASNSAMGGGSASGGGIANAGTLTIIGSTVSGNKAQVGPAGGNACGIDNSGTLRMQNTILAGNTRPIGQDFAERDLHGSLQSLGHNLIGSGDGGSGYADTDLVGTASNPIDPLLGPLQDNGGPTQTMALLPGSPAIDAGALTDMEWDQRGPGYPRLVHGATDIGAYEVQVSLGSASAAHAVQVFERIIGLPAATPSPVPIPTSAPAGTATRIVPLAQTTAVVNQLFALEAGEEFRFLLPY